MKQSAAEFERCGRLRPGYGEPRRSACAKAGAVLGAMMLVVTLGLAISGCAKARAATQPEMPALDAPPVPPRVIVPVAADGAQSTSEPIADDEPATRAPRAAPARTEPPRPTSPARVDRDADQPAKPEESRPGRTLQTPASAVESERKIRDQLARASDALQRVNYQTLNSNLREQYETAKRFIQQAEENLAKKNLVYAATLADKAWEIAEVLPRR